MPQTADATVTERIRPSGTIDVLMTPAEARDATEDDGRPVTVMGPTTISLGTLWRSATRLIHYRDLLYTLSLHRLQVRYKQSVLGWLWAILQPLSLMLIYTVIFTRVGKVETTVPYPLFAYSALLVWTCFSTAVATGTNSLVSHFSLVTKVYFPREILPLSYVLAALADLLAGGVALGGLMVYFHVPLTMHAWHVLPAVAVLMVFALAVSFVLSAIQVRYRDIGIAMPLLLQLWMFGTPVVYPLSAVPAAWRWWYVLNPMVGVVETFRRVLAEGKAPEYMPLLISAAISLAVLPIAFLYFKRVEATVADVL